MSVYAVNGERQEQIASNMGWGEFCDWVDGLEVDAADEVIHLREYGWTDEPGIAADQLRDALSQSPPDANTQSVAAALGRVLVAAQADDVVAITDGMTGDNEGHADQFAIADEPNSTDEDADGITRKSARTGKALHAEVRARLAKLLSKKNDSPNGS